MLPDGSGDILVDSAYGGKKSCQAIQDSECRPIIDPKSNCVIKGFNYTVNMLRFREEHPRTYCASETMLRVSSLHSRSDLVAWCGH